LPLTQGEAIHRWFFSLLVDQKKQELASRLHSQKPCTSFTTSPLQGALTRQGMFARVQADQTYWLRVTSLEHTLSEFLRDIEVKPPKRVSLEFRKQTSPHLPHRCIEDKPPTRVRPFDVEFAVSAVTSDPQVHAWAGQSTYEHLYAQAWENPPATQVPLQFFSPTVFRSQIFSPTVLRLHHRNQLLPSPRLIFSSLWESWHAFAPQYLTLPDALLPLLSTELDVLRYELKTRMLQFEEYRQKGFVGSCTLGLPRHPAAPDTDVLRCMHLLCNTAFFAGVGYKTPMGMGQARRLS
jgi:CRISPR-associated endoribonuclease Cas6